MKADTKRKLMNSRPRVAAERQPTPETVVWQHNQLAEARYQLTPREQKLLLYVIAMIEPEDHDFKRYVVNIADFAKVLNLGKDDLYEELREVAKALKQKPLVIPNHCDADTGKYVELITSWFDTAYIGKKGSGYFAVTLSPVLKPYLLQVKREFFRFRLYQVMQLKSGYAIRLYQWAKRWEFRKTIEISIPEMRQVLGPGDDALTEYADFKRRAIRPAISEINEKSDLYIAFKEMRRPGSKAIEKLLMTITRKATPKVEIVAPALSPQFEFDLENKPVKTLNESLPKRDLLSECAERYGLNEKQGSLLRQYYTEKGEGYVREKILAVDQEPRANAARAILAALRDDWKPKIKTKDSKLAPLKAPCDEDMQDIPVSPELGKELTKNLRTSLAATFA
jgi:hypothetical protein